MFQRILVPLDGSEIAEQILPVVERLRIGGAVLQLVRVNPSPPESPTPYDETLQLEAESYLDFIVSRLSDRGIAAQWETRCGDVAAEVLAAAREHGCDLVAISSHGRSGMARLVFGNTAERILQRAEIPTLLVRALGSNAPRPARLESILVPLDGTPVSEQALDVALQVAREVGARVHLLYVIESLWAAGDSKLARDQLKEVRRTAGRLRELAERVRSERVPGRMLLVRGDPSSEVLGHVARYGMDLIVMTPTSASGRPAAFGRVSEKVLRAAPVPVLVVRSLPDKGTERRPTQA
ncbi:MAG: universal stress protein [Planctomycetes bacterium]|nr:universal stress protein [Planctomycetota bacterium]